MPIATNLLREKEDYQKLIMEHLIQENGFRERISKDHYSQGLAMDTELLMEFLEKTQSSTLNSLRRIYKDNTEEKIISVINEEINKGNRGLIDVIKNGVEFDDGSELELMYRKPDSEINKDAINNYNNNIFSVMEEVYHKEDERVDLVIFLNGLAVFAIELKCNTSGQNFEDAINQYKKERDPDTRLFKSKVGVLAAFAMDLNEVYFTTELKREDTFFNPFNTGDNFGKGNPHNDKGINVSYMWEDIFTKDRIALLIERFIYIKTVKKVDPDTGEINIKRVLIFPRFHQLRAVERVMNDIIVNHSQYNYLIEHSAGSGKTETISWLSHILSSIHDKDDISIFDKVLVITDRIIVDRQLQDAIMGIEHQGGHVVVMDDECHSDDLAHELKGNTRIIVTTIHKFYYILNNKLLEKMKSKSFAVLIDEAHSSTGGTLMRSVNSVLSNMEPKTELDEEDMILDEIRKSGKQDNVSMIAFTATPKPETLQQFGTTNSNGGKEAFDLYSMKQAIDEGYILNVLDNYVTWKTYCHINKIDEDDPVLNTFSAKRAMLRFIDEQETNIEQKIEIIIEHFKNNVAQGLGGKAKAMIVTSSRPAAVKYRLAFENYVKEKGYDDIAALVAFSGQVTVNDSVTGEDKEYTEVSMNHISEKKLRFEFDKKSYQFLIVADKYQTGFDQPKLCAMYVDKTLSGIPAVQTLSRLNRVYRPYNKTTFILDFKNDYEDIKNSFEPFYKDTIQFEKVTVEDVESLEEKIEEFGIVNSNDIEEFNKYLYQKERSSADKERMWSLLNSSFREYEQKQEEEQLLIKTIIKRFLKTYCFLIQVSCFENISLHKKYNYLSYLIKEMNPGSGGNDFDIADKIVVSDFRQEEIETHNGGDIGDNNEELHKPKRTLTVKEMQKKKLSEIINELNSLYDSDYKIDSTVDDAINIKELLLSTDYIKEKLKNSVENNEYDKFMLTYDDCVVEVLKKGYDRNTKFYGFLLNNEEVRTRITNVFVRDVYSSLKNSH